MGSFFGADGDGRFQRAFRRCAEHGSTSARIVFMQRPPTAVVKVAARPFVRATAQRYGFIALCDCAGQQRTKDGNHPERPNGPPFSATMSRNNTDK